MIKLKLLKMHYEEEEGDERMFAENIKYDEDYYNNYIKNYLNDGRYAE